MSIFLVVYFYHKIFFLISLSVSSFRTSSNKFFDSDLAAKVPDKESVFANRNRSSSSQEEFETLLSPLYNR